MTIIKKSTNLAMKYFLISGMVTHIVFILLAGFFVTEKFSGHWRVKAAQRFLLGPIDHYDVYNIPRDKNGYPNYQLIPPNTWLKVHQQSKNDALIFSRQRHSGSAWDSKRNRLIVYGSDTHGENWDNSIYAFELNNLAWTREYTPTSLDSYRVDLGIPLSGSSTKPHPWAMHAFDAINYLPLTDELVIASHPLHLKPGQFGNWLNDLWPQITKHPTWIYNFANKSWRAESGKAEHFFPYATAYNSLKGTVVGFRPNGIFEFDPASSSWEKIGKKSVYAYHTQAVYDKKQNTFLIFGGSNLTSNIYAFKHGDSDSKKMPTPGTRPPPTQHSPFSYHDGISKSVAIIDLEPKSTGAETWIYDLNRDSWEQIETAIFPFKLGMNYHLQYSPKDNIMVLMANAEQEAPSVWVLKL